MIDNTLYVSTMYTRVVALDAGTGEELFGNPMTYITREGRQFVVIATGAGPDASLVAFALPEG